jgi:hypothetical protein
MRPTRVPWPAPLPSSSGEQTVSYGVDNRSIPVGWFVLDVPGFAYEPTSPTTGSISSSLPLSGAIDALKNAGFEAHFWDEFNRNHPGQLDLRDHEKICSAHVALNKNSGQSGQPTTGDVHLDHVNPLPPRNPIFLIGPPVMHYWYDQRRTDPGDVFCAGQI